MMNKIILFFLVIFFCFSQCCCAQIDPYEVLSKISYQRNSRDWHNRNDHLIPSNSEIEAILKLRQKRDFENNDIDKDGVENKLDPSPFDWREIGYQPFGVLSFLSWRHFWNEYKYTPKDLKKVTKLIKNSGVAFVRMDFLWQDIEAEKGKFRFAKYDQIVALCARMNIRILGVLGYSAPWAAKEWNSPPSNLGDFANFCNEVVSRYKDVIKYWEVWNEPDSKFYWSPQDDMKTYTQLLKKSYIAIKKTDPSSKVVLGGMTAQGYYAIKRIYENGGKNYFDIINIHPFINPLRPREFQRIYAFYKNIQRLQLQFSDKDKKIWFTEIGCPGVPNNVESKGWWEGASPNEKQQADYLYRIFTDLIELPNLEKIFWAFFRDNKEHFKNDVDYFGMIRWDYSKKRSYSVYYDRYKNWLRSKRSLGIERKTVGGFKAPTFGGTPLNNETIKTDSTSESKY